ncbi:MAG: hypothetical protein IKU38_00845 [Clostridia bacterium]|nr:hypothetical protein [Clostridia bacterium]
MTTISIIVLTAACFFAAVLNLAVENRFRNRITGIFTAISIGMGILFYGYGFAHQLGLSVLTVVRALFALCKMFGGSNELSAISDAPLFSHGWVLTVFWLVHFMAFYVTASTAIAAVGSKVIRRIRVMLLRRGVLVVIFGVNAQSVEYGSNQCDKKKQSVVFVGECSDASVEASVHAMGAVLVKGAPSLNGWFLHRLGIYPGKRRIRIAALHEDGNKNLEFAQRLLKAMEEAGIRSGQTELIVQGVEDEQVEMLMACRSDYGYGSVFAMDEYELCARLMIHNVPPCEMICFDSNAKATQDFSVLMVGFGRMGRAALEQLIMNSQFVGSTFRADIFDAGAQKGVLHNHEILKRYDVRFHAHNGKSEAMYAFLAERFDKIRCIVLCTGSEKENSEIARDLRHWFREQGALPAVIQMNKNVILFSRAEENELQCLHVYDGETLDIERIDRMAMVINQMYCGAEQGTALDNWMHCDYFSRMSSRASADFYPAMLRAAGKTAEQVLAGEWPPHRAALENLAITEHLRWCAFHYVMGFKPMSPEEFDARAQRYQAQVREQVKPLRISKDMHNRRHACLVDWDELDALSEKENAVTKGRADYKQMDRNNVLILPEMLKALHDLEQISEGGK